MNKMDERQLQRFKAFLSNEPIVSILSRNLSFLLDEDKRIKSVEVNARMESYTDGSIIVVSGLPMFITEDYDKRHWLVTLRVNLAHEVQHGNSSDFDLILKLRDWYRDYLFDNFQINKGIGAKVAQYVLNCVEDGRINEIVVQRFPGYLAMMRWVNYAIRDYNTIEAIANNPKDELSHFFAQLISYSKTGLSAPGMENYDGTEMEAEFAKIKNFIDEGIASPTARGCFDSCVALLTTSAPYIAKLSKDDSDVMDFIDSLHLEDYSQSSENREEQRGQGNGAGQSVRRKSKGTESKKQQGKQSGDSKSSASSEGEGKGKCDNEEEGKGEGENEGDNEGEGKGKKKSDSVDGNEEKQSSKKSSDGDTKNSCESALERAKKEGPKSVEEVIGSDSSDDESPALTDEEVASMLEASKEVLHKANVIEKANVVDKGQNTPLSIKDKAELGKRYQSMGNVNFSESFVTPENKTLSGELKGKANELHNNLAKTLQNKKAFVSSQRKGSISPSSLWKVGVDNPDIFKRKSPPNEVDCVFYELIDRSGSMASSAYSGSENRAVSKLFAAISTAAVIEEALKGIAKTKIVAFDGGFHEVQHVVIKDFEQPPIGNRCFDALTQVSANNGNMDGYSIRVATMDLVKRPEKQKILVVLSDGLPSAYRNSEDALDDVRQAVHAARRQGIIVIPIMFGMGNSKMMIEEYKKMYEKHIICTDPNNILKEFMDLLPKLIK